MICFFKLEVLNRCLTPIQCINLVYYVQANSFSAPASPILCGKDISEAGKRPSLVLPEQSNPDGAGSSISPVRVLQHKDLQASRGAAKILET